MSEQDVSEISQYSRETVCENLKLQGFAIPECAKKSEQELDAWILFAKVNDEARTVFGEDWNDSAAKVMINESLATLDRMRDIGYHDKTHPIRFAATYLAQAVEVRRMLNAGEDQELISFVRKRLASKRLREDNGRLLWESDASGVTVYIVDQLKKEFNTAHVQEVLCAAFEHDSEEQDTTKETHEAVYAYKIFEKHPLRAQMVLSTRYSTAKRSVQNQYDHLESPIEICQDGYSQKFDLRSDSIAIHLSARMFASCDYIEMFARDGYVDRSWFAIAGIDELSNINDPEVIKPKSFIGRQIASLATRIKLLEEVAETTPTELSQLRSDLQDMVNLALKNYPLALLWGEMFSGSKAKALEFLRTTDLAIAVGSMKFPNFQLSNHRASLELLKRSPFAEQFEPRLPNFQESQFQETWMKGNSPDIMERLVRFYLYLNTEMSSAEKDKLAFVFGRTYELFVRGMLIFDENPQKSRFDFVCIKNLLSHLNSHLPIADG